MKDKLDPESEEQERLEQFLRWRQAVGRNRGRPDRRLLFLFGGTALGAVASTLILTILGTSLNRPTRFASERTSASPSSNVATAVSRDTPSPVPSNIPTSGSARELPGPVAEAEPAAVAIAPREEHPVAEAEPAAVAIAPREEHPVVEPSRPERIEPRASRRARGALESRALPPRSPSQWPQFPKDLAGLAQPSDLAPAASPAPRPPVQAGLDQLPSRDESGGAMRSSAASSPTFAPPAPAAQTPDTARDVTATATLPPPPSVQAHPEQGGARGEAGRTGSTEASSPVVVTAVVPAAQGRDVTERGTAATAAPLSPAQPPRDSVDPRGEAIGATGSTTVVASAPVTVPSSRLPASPGLARATGERSETLETVKWLVGYIPEVRAGKAIVRWVKSQPPVDPGTAPLKPEVTQAR
jgi:hypothetical protein